MARRRLGFWKRLAVVIIKPTATLMTHRDWRGAEHVPQTGGVIFVANHVTWIDPLTIAHYVYDAGRWPRYLAKDELFRNRLLGFLLRHFGQVPVYRGTVDAAKSLEAAVAAVGRGAAIIIYPEGTLTKDPHLWPMRGKSGAARLALATGAPVVPIAQWGTHDIHDRLGSRRLRFRRARVTVVTGPQVDLSEWRDAAPTTATLDEMTNHMMYRLRDMVAEIRGEAPPAELFSLARTKKGEG